MKASEIRQKFIKYYEKKEHKNIGSSSLIPKDDPTTLFTGSGMQPLLPYLLGEEHKMGVRLVNSQKSFRAEDIDEIGDNRHTTFFEMLGNWSLGDYFKKEQLPWVFDFVVNELGLDPNKIYVTVFIGDKENGIPKDEESAETWERLFSEKGIEAKLVEIGSEENGYEIGMQGGRIFYYDNKKNWWSRAGIPANMPVGEPGGPDSEIFYEFTDIEHDKSFGEHCHPNCDCGRYMEIGNSVFMEYIKKEDGTFEPLKQKNVDFGGGLERMAAAVADDPDMFNVDILTNIIENIESITGKKYEAKDKELKKSFRILADHMRAATFLLADGARPSNLHRGYVLRRLIRRAIRFAKLADIFEKEMCAEIAGSVINDYALEYPELKQNEASIVSELNIEEAKFIRTLEEGIKEFEKIIIKKNEITGKDAFNLFATHGFPFEMTKEMAEEKGIKIDETGFKEEFEKHQEISKAGIEEKKFKGGLADANDPMVIKYHTTAHLLLAALRDVLGDHIHQKGSNITAERLRFDFSHPEKMSDEEKEKIEDWVNDKISQKLNIFITETDPVTAKNNGAEGEFTAKYGEKITVYSIGGDLESSNAVSKEICGGPHIKNTSELGTFKIQKEESSSAGVRRIKAIFEK